MKKSVLFLISLLLINGVLAERTIDLDYPQEVSVGQKFNVDIMLNNFDEGVYDVKIDILGSGNRISKIWNGDSWKSTFNYLNNVIDLNEQKQESFKLKIDKEYEGEAEIQIKLKDSKNKSYSFTGYNIGIIGGKENTDNEEDFKKPDEEIKEKNKEEKTTEKTNTNLDYEKIDEDNLPKQTVIAEVIKLNSQKNLQSESIKSENSMVYESKNELIKKFSIYGFAMLLVMLCILLAFNKLR